MFNVLTCTVLVWVRISKKDSRKSFDEKWYEEFGTT
jgi:hypothetical protein